MSTRSDRNYCTKGTAEDDLREVCGTLCRVTMPAEINVQFILWLRFVSLRLLGIHFTAELLISDTNARLSNVITFGTFRLRPFKLLITWLESANQQFHWRCLFSATMTSLTSAWRSIIHSIPPRTLPSSTRVLPRCFIQSSTGGKCRSRAR